VTTLVLATRNLKKLAELRRILDEADLAVELAGPEVFAQVPDIAETGTTFAENAMLKARAVAEATGLPAVADDSGLCVAALNGMPGILSARWAGRHGDDEANLDLVLGQLADVPDDRRAAHFACAAALALPDGSGEVVTGELHGTLLRERRGTNGFGYDPIFVPDGYAVTTAELESADKDAISHRGRALRALVPHIAARVSGVSGAAGPGR
jgi:XTP/dITP diphosphohydrolase